MAGPRSKPGWKWSTSVKPIVGGDSCQVDHVGAVISGQLHVELDDGTSLELGAGDVYHIAPGHDAWVVGDETFDAVEWSGGAATYATPPT